MADNRVGAGRRLRRPGLLCAAIALHCLLLMPLGTARADEAEKDLVLDDIIVTATRVPMARTRVSAPATVLTQEEIQRGPFRSGYQVDDLLRYVPTVQPSNLSSRYNHPTAQAVSLRGLGSRRALVLLDGVPLNDGFGGWINWGLVPDRIERIEIIPGGGSNLYGTWAMGGVINIISQPSRVTPALTGEVSGGNLGTNSQSVGGRYGNERFGIVLGYRHFDTAGFVTVPSYQRGSVDGAVDSGHQQFNGSLSWGLSPRARATLSGNFFHEDRMFGTALSLASRTIGTAALGFEGETVHWGKWETKVFAQWQTFRNQTSTIVPSSLVRQAELLERLQTIPSNDYGGMGQWTMPLWSHSRLVLGSDVRAVIGQSQEQLFSSQSRQVARGKQLGLGTFAEWIVEPIDALTITASVRWDWWKNFDGTRETASGATVRTRDNVASILNPKIGFLYGLTERIRIGASLYQAFRAPTLNELYREFSFAGFTFQANDRLEPERLTGGEFKVETDLLPREQLGFRATAHYDLVKDQILLVTQGPTSAMRQNVGQARSIGADFEVNSRVNDRLFVRLGYSYVDSIVTSFPGNPSREGLRIPTVSRHQVIAAVTVGDVSSLQFTLQCRYLSRQFADDLNRQAIADFVLLDASLRRRIVPQAELFITGENLTDRQYIATQTGAIKTLGQPLLVLAGLKVDL